MLFKNIQVTVGGIMHEELILVTDRLEQAVAERNVDEIVDILTNLRETFIYSGNEVYDRFGAIKSEMLIVLFEKLEINEFCRFFLESNKIYSTDICLALETISERISFDMLWTMKDYYGLPGPFWTPKLYAILSNEPDTKISEELIAAIEHLSEHESQDGTDFSEHEARMSTFRYIRWAPSDGGLSELVKLLGSRKDEVAHAASEKYLMELPWGIDRGATVSLLDGLSLRKDEKCHELLNRALSIHQEPIMLRLWLWRALYYGHPTEAVLGVIDDFGMYKKSEDLILLIDFLGNLLQNIRSENKEFDEEQVTAAVENVNTDQWSFVVRGYYGTLLLALLPKADYRRKSGFIGRGFISVAQIWDRIQLDHMGCVVPLLLMIGVAVFFLWGLDLFFGKPSKDALRAPTVFFVIWIAWAIVNTQTHFSGQKTLVQKFLAVLIYFGSLLSAMVTSVLVRL